MRARPDPHRCRKQNMTDHDLTPTEKFLLIWLSKEDFSQYGECHGTALDSLVAKGLAQIHDEESGINNHFIAKGRDIMYRAVSLTESGWEARKQIKEQEP